MTKQISISDEGTSSIATLTEQGLTVIGGGGCPMAKLLGTLDVTMDNDDLAEVIRERWSNGYDGDTDTIRVSVEDEEAA